MGAPNQYCRLSPKPQMRNFLPPAGTQPFVGGLQRLLMRAYQMASSGDQFCKLPQTYLLMNTSPGNTLWTPPETCCEANRKLPRVIIMRPRKQNSQKLLEEVKKEQISRSLSSRPRGGGHGEEGKLIRELTPNYPPPGSRATRNGLGGCLQNVHGEVGKLIFWPF